MKRTVLNNVGASGWSVREFIDVEGFFSRSYFFKKSKAFRVELTDPLSRQLSGYKLIEKDLRNVLIWLDTIEMLLTPPKNKSTSFHLSNNKRASEVAKGLFISSLVSYGKCFSRCDGRKIKLEKNIISTEYMLTHQEVICLRNNYAAHGGNSIGERCDIVILIPRRRFLNKIFPVIHAEIYQLNYKGIINEGKNFKSLVAHVKMELDKKIHILEQKILSNNTAPKMMDYWYKIAKKKNSSRHFKVG